MKEITKKNKRTLSALARILGCHEVQVRGELPDLGEKGIATALIQGWSYDGEKTLVVEDLILRYDRLPSGRVGQWELDAVDCDKSSPSYGKKFITSGTGQFGKAFTV